MTTNLRSDQRGAAAVELALVLPVLLLILAGIIEFGRGYHEKISMTHAAREGARALAVGKTASVAEATAVGAATGVGLTTAEVSTVPASGTCTPGSTVTVEINHRLDFFIQLIGDGVDLTSKASMRCGG